MKQLMAFMKKEFLEQLRTGRVILLISLFFLFGILNPATVKMMPWLLDLMSEQLAKSGMIINNIHVNAMTSWTQFFKNMPILLIVFIVMFSGILTTEYQKGTLINVITKGLKRWKILVSKMAVMVLLWTVGYLISFGITYGYNAYFWDNSIVKNLIFSVFGYYLAGIWLISIILLSSTILKSSSGVILSVETGFITSYLLGFLSVLHKYVPTFILSANELLIGVIDSSEYVISVGIIFLLLILNVILSIFIFNKRMI